MFWVYKWKDNGKNFQLMGRLHIQHRVRLGDNISLFNNKIKDNIIGSFLHLPILFSKHRIVLTKELQVSKHLSFQKGGGESVFPKKGGKGDHWIIFIHSMLTPFSDQNESLEILQRSQILEAPLCFKQGCSDILQTTM